MPIRPDPQSFQAPATVEIAAVLGDSVLSVHHLTDTRGGRLSAATRVLFAAAALGLVACAVAAGIAVGIARDNQAAQAAWLADGNAAIDFHPRRLAPIFDLLCGVGLVGGVACSAWALARAQRERRPATFRVGRAPGLELAVDGLEDFTVVGPIGDALCFTPAPGMTGEMVIDDKAQPLAAGPIPRGARIRAQLDGVTVLVSAVAPPRAELAPASFDRRALGYGVASAAGHAMLILLFFALPASASGLSEDDLGASYRMTHATMIPSELPKPETGTGNGALGDSTVAPSAAEKGAAGALGHPDTDSHGKAKMKHVADTPSIARPEERVLLARSAGVLGVMKAQRDQITALTATGDFTNGLDDEDIRGGYQGDAYADNRGFGTGLDGRGPGGGGRNLNTIGGGPYVTPGYTSLHLPPGDLMGRRPRPPTVTFGDVTSAGHLSRDLIRRAIQQKRAQFAWCYQKELTVRPALEGTVNTEFTITKEGRLLDVRAGGLAPEVERCVEDTMRTVSFPASAEIIHVTSYPFTYRRAGL